MIDISTKEAIAKLRAEFHHITDQDMREAVNRAINLQLLPSKKLAIQKITALYNIPAEYLNEKTVIKLVRSKQNLLTAKILVNVSAISLNVFDPVETAKGVELEIKRGQKVLIKGAFMGIMPNGGYGVFARGKYKAGKFDFRNKRIKSAGGHVLVNGTRRPKNNDLTINNLKSVSAYTSFIKPAVMQALEDRITKQFPRSLARQLMKLDKSDAYLF